MNRVDQNLVCRCSSPNKFFKFAADKTLSNFANNFTKYDVDVFKRVTNLRNFQNIIHGICVFYNAISITAVLQKNCYFLNLISVFHIILFAATALFSLYFALLFWWLIGKLLWRTVNTACRDTRLCYLINWFSSLNFSHRIFQNLIYRHH